LQRWVIVARGLALLDHLLIPFHNPPFRRCSLFWFRRCCCFAQQESNLPRGIGRNHERSVPRPGKSHTLRLFPPRSNAFQIRRNIERLGLQIQQAAGFERSKQGCKVIWLVQDGRRQFDRTTVGAPRPRVGRILNNHVKGSGRGVANKGGAVGNVERDAGVRPRLGAPGKVLLARFNDAAIEIDVIHVRDRVVFENFVQDVPVAAADNQDALGMRVLKHGHVGHHFIVRVRVSFRELYHTVEDEYFAIGLALQHLNVLVMRPRLVENGTVLVVTDVVAVILVVVIVGGCLESNGLIKARFVNTFTNHHGGAIGRCGRKCVMLGLTGRHEQGRRAQCRLCRWWFPTRVGGVEFLLVTGFLW